jgi:hypothetical protein
MSAFDYCDLLVWRTPLHKKVSFVMLYPTLEHQNSDQKNKVIRDKRASSKKEPFSSRNYQTLIY